MRIILRIFMFIVLLPIAACARAQSRPSDFENQIFNAFETIYLSRFGLNYPKYKEDVATAIACNDEERLKTFKDVMNAKDFIQEQIRLDPERVLKITLNAIFQVNPARLSTPRKNAPKESQRDQFRTIGAIIALYFFQTEEQDLAIFERTRTASPKILDELFLIAYAWQYNRPNPERWIAFVETIPDTAFSIDRKNRIITTFKTKNFRNFGIMLDRPPALSH